MWESFGHWFGAILGICTAAGAGVIAILLCLFAFALLLKIGEKITGIPPKDWL